MIQETHIKGTIITNLDGYVLPRSGGESRRYGVGSLVSKDLEGRIVTFVPVVDRISCTKIKDVANVLITNLHAPTEGKMEDKKYEFMKNWKKFMTI